MKKGKFIVVEGGDGAGKTTFINFLKKKYPDFVYSREPGGFDFSQEIRSIILMDKAKRADPLTMFHLFWASRAENTAKVIRSNLKKGNIVISDRFDVSTFAYQVGENPALEEPFWSMRRLCLDGIVPTYINLEVSPIVSKLRMDDRGEKNHFDSRDEAYHSRVQMLYKKFFENPSIIGVTINANEPEKKVIKSAHDAFRKIIKSK